ncbi:hypothetical protein MTO96_003810 [Rhipicephalus appendiculatus]
MTEKPEQGDRGRGTTRTTNDVPQGVQPATAVPPQNEQSHVDRRMSDASAGGRRNVSRRPQGRLQTQRPSADLSQARESCVDHPATEPPRKAPVPNTRSTFSTADAGSYLSGPDTLGGAAHLTQVMQSSLHDLQKPEVENTSLWQGLRALIADTVRRHRHRSISLLLFSAAAAVVLLCLVVIAVIGIFYDRESRKVCGNVDCLHHVMALRLPPSDNATAACTNFASFVCAGVRNRYGALAESVIVHRIMDNRLTSTMQPTLVSLFSRPLEMTRKCINGDSLSDGELIALVDFMQDKSFAWPTPNDNDTFTNASSKNYTQPLNILLDLAVTWQMPIWFRCHLFRQQKGRRRIIRLSTSSVGYAAQRLQNMFLGSGSYYSYVSLIESLIFSRREPTSEFLSFVRRSKKMQEDVFSKLANVYTDSLFEPKKVTLANMPLLVRQFTVDDWLIPLQKVYDADPRIDPGDVVLATNSRLLAAMNELLEAYTLQEITFHTIWWFAQYACTVTSRILFNAISNAQFGMAMQRSYCASLSMELYHVHWAAAYKAITSMKDQLRIGSCLENIKTVAADKLASTTRVDSVTRHSLVNVLTNIEPVIWPNGSLATAEGLEHMYGPAYNGFGGVFGESLEIVRYMRRFRGTQQDDFVATMFVPSDGNRLTSYDPVTNTIAMATDAIGPPLYYSSGTSAMIYGGLGFVYSMEVATALNSISYLIRDDASEVPVLSPNASFPFAPSCANVQSPFPELTGARLGPRGVPPLSVTPTRTYLSKALATARSKYFSFLSATARACFTRTVPVFLRAAMKRSRTSRHLRKRFPAQRGHR